MFVRIYLVSRFPVADPNPGWTSVSGRFSRIGPSRSFLPIILFCYMSALRWWVSFFFLLFCFSIFFHHLVRRHLFTAVRMMLACLLSRHNQQAWSVFRVGCETVTQWAIRLGSLGLWRMSKYAQGEGDCGCGNNKAVQKWMILSCVRS